MNAQKKLDEAQATIRNLTLRLAEASSAYCRELEKVIDLKKQVVQLRAELAKDGATVADRNMKLAIIEKLACDTAGEPAGVDADTDQRADADRHRRPDRGRDGAGACLCNAERMK